MSPIDLGPAKIKKITLAVFTLHNWLLQGPSRSVYVVLGLVDGVNPVTHEVTPATWRNTLSNDCNGMLPLQPPRHRNSQHVMPKKFVKSSRNIFVLKVQYLGSGSYVWVESNNVTLLNLISHFNQCLIASDSHKNLRGEIHHRALSTETFLYV